MVDAVAVGGAGWACEREVPFEEVGVEGGGVEGAVGMELELGGFAEDALYCGRFGVEGWGVRHGC